MVPNQHYTINGVVQRQFNHPAVRVVENRQAPLTSYAGISVASGVVDRLGIAQAIDEWVQLLERHKPYHESDHVLSIVYNLLTGGESLVDIERLRAQQGVANLFGAEQIPDPTTVGDFLARFGGSDLLDMQ